MSLETIAAFLTGMGSIVGGTYALRRARREERQRCDERVTEIRESYEQGIDKGLHMSERGMGELD